MDSIEITAEDLVNRLLQISKNENVCILDSGGIDHQNSHLLLAGVRPVEIIEIWDETADSALQTFDQKLSRLDLAAIFTISYDFGLKLENIFRSKKEYPVSEPEMARLSHFPTPSPVLALGRLERHSLDTTLCNQGLTLALDGVQDAGNVGTLLRVADWFGFDRVLLSPDCADLYSQKVINASMGSFLRVTTYTVSLAGTLAAATAPVLGCDLEGEDVHGLRALPDAIVVIGSEGRGLSPAVRACITRFVTIPKFGVAESLNAAVAAAIVCDNLRRVRA